MPFGLKNAGATYQRLVNRIFKDQLGKTMEAYVDDMLVKSLVAGQHCKDLREIFELLQRYHMKLNPSKCVFGVSAGKFLGFMVTCRGIEANPDKIRALLEMEAPRTKKEIQVLTKRIASLNRFVSCSGDKGLPFFKTLKKKGGFKWEEEQTKASELLNQYLGSPPLLTKAKNGEDLYLYIASTENAVSSVLVWEEGRKHQPIYYTSKVLSGAEKNNCKMEKAAFSIVCAVRKLRPYFQAHKVLTDFTAERFSDSSTKPNVWTLHVDGSSNAAGRGARFILLAPDGNETLFTLKLEFTAINNDAEYEALLAALHLADALGVTQIKVLSDSQLVVEQLKGEFEARDPIMKKYLLKAQEYEKAFVWFDVEHIPRAENKKADALAKLASATSAEWKDAIYLERIGKPSYEEDKVNSVESEINRNDWRAPLFLFLQDGSLPEDNKEALRVRRKAARYTLINRKLYRLSLTLPYLHCLNDEEGTYILREIHKGVCKNHLASRVVAHKAIRQGFYWPTMKKDAVELVKRCDRCQRSTITEQNITRFVWTSLVCRYGISWAIVTDHERQFDNERFKKFSSNLSIKLLFALVAHPQSNGQVENMNRTILHGLRTRLESMQGRWAEELPSLIWVYHTTKRAATGETPFMLVFGAEAVIPAEVGMPSWRRQYFNEQTNNEEPRSEIDLLEERQDQASLKVAAYQ
ncbi:uncharacterized protein LOC131151272 [Malania oleifera]|uniref:uncharacterized protein LOC131151272 n=1 Tax=Malania oleifera TaxID=397392 RepID=UPI0025ADBA98|nr:uncharacterized protein LOC131151272 [Malania oleifera]